MRRILIFITLIFYSLSTYAAEFNKIIYLGDSLSDSGNLYKLIQIIPSSPPYYSGRFTNGPTWAEFVSKYYYDKYQVKSSNYAYGGATALPRHFVHDWFTAPFTLDDELNLYLLSSGRDDRSQTLHVIWIGGNDYLYDKKSDIDKLTTAVVNRIMRTVTILVKNDAKHFLILNLPDLSRSPFIRWRDRESRANSISLMHNQKLANSLNAFKQTHPDISLNLIDIFALTEDLSMDPEKYNRKYNMQIKNISDPCLTHIFGLEKTVTLRELQSELKDVSVKNNTMAEAILHSPELSYTYAAGKHAQNYQACTNPHEYVFWDQIHPTEATQKLLAKIIIERLDREYRL